MDFKYSWGFNGLSKKQKYKDKTKQKNKSLKWRHYFKFKEYLDCIKDSKYFFSIKWEIQHFFGKVLPFQKLNLTGY